MKDILVRIRDFEARQPAGDYGMRLAATLGGAVSGIFVYPYLYPTYVPAPYTPEVLGTLLIDARNLENKATHDGRDKFAAWARAMGATQAEWLVAEGDAPAALAHAATRHDLVVLDQAPDAQPDAVSDLPAQIMKVGVPCIVVPRKGVHDQPIERAALAWNGSPEAMRAVHAALPLLQGKRVLLLRGEERDVYQGMLWKTPLDIVAYLGRHGVSVETREIAAMHDETGAALLEEAHRFHADLLVMGAYGRSRFSEWLLGGATRDALAFAELPVLYHH